MTAYDILHEILKYQKSKKRKKKKLARAVIMNYVNI